MERSADIFCGENPYPHFMSCTVLPARPKMFAVYNIIKKNTLTDDQRNKAQ